MSDETPEENVGGLDEILPPSLMPIYNGYLRIENFRSTYGETYTGIMEAIVALVLILGYIYWLYLFFIAG